MSRSGGPWLSTQLWLVSPHGATLETRAPAAGHFLGTHHQPQKEMSHSWASEGNEVAWSQADMRGAR